MVSLENIDRKLQNSFNAIKIEMTSFKDKLAEIDDIKKRLDTHKEYLKTFKELYNKLALETINLRKDVESHSKMRKKVESLNSIENQIKTLEKLSAKEKDLLELKNKIENLERLNLKEQELNQFKKQMSLLSEKLEKSIQDFNIHANEEIKNLKRDTIKLRNDLDIKLANKSNKGIFNRVIDTFADEYDR